MTNPYSSSSDSDNFSGDYSSSESAYPEYEAFPSDSNANSLVAQSGPGAFKRLIGWFVDGILSSIPAMIIAYFIVGADKVKDIEGNGLAEFTTWTSIISVVVFLVYRIAMEVGAQGSLGKKLIGAKVVDENDDPLSFVASLKRNCWNLIPLIPFAGSILSIVVEIAIGVTISNGNDNRSFMDRFAGAWVKDK